MPTNPSHATIRIGSSIKTDTAGFNLIANLHNKIATEVANGRGIILDMSSLSWIDANMCAPLGAVIVNAILGTGGLRIIRPHSSAVSSILDRNGFIPTLLKREKPRDYAGTAIEFKVFPSSTQGERDFSGHAHRVLADRDGFYTSEGLKHQLVTSVLEIFNNSVIHSGSPSGIFACGQFFPIKHRVRLTISDLGLGILPKVARHLNASSMNSATAIKWAVQKGNTTKQGTPGGLGLGLLREFIDINGGKMQIVSGDCVWHYENKREACHMLTTPILGTSVSITINTGVGALYKLKSEQDFNLDDIF